MNIRETIELFHNSKGLIDKKETILQKLSFEFEDDLYQIEFCFGDYNYLANGDYSIATGTHFKPFGAKMVRYANKNRAKVRSRTYNVSIGNPYSKPGTKARQEQELYKQFVLSREDSIARIFEEK